MVPYHNSCHGRLGGSPAQADGNDLDMLARARAPPICSSNSASRANFPTEHPDLCPLSAAVPRGVVASARKSGTGCGAVACWGLGLVVVLGLPGLAVAGMMVRAARDAEPLWDKSPFISLALGPDPVGRFLLP